MRNAATLGSACSLALALGLAAQEIPSPRDVSGYDLGDRFTPSAGAVEYARSLADRSPRVRLSRYGETAEGRPLILLVIAREDRWDRLDEIRERNRRLVDPETSDSEVEAIAARNPAIVWLGYGVHGDESSSTEAALWTAYDLASDAPEARGLLDSLIVVVDPILNPDGRDRYVNWYRTVRAAPPNPEPASLEHDPPWPRGRYNHYLFDLNRDWAWSTQRETRARLAAWLEWRPHVHVDFHEMSPYSTYFFFPATPPINPIYPQSTLRWARYFGDAIGDEFDRRRWLYFTRERFDLFYPGYGDSWPSLWGAIGMTFEQAGGGSAGLAFRRPDGTVLTLEERATHHRVSSLATLRAAADRKTELLRSFADFHRATPPAGGHTLLVPGPTSAADSLATLLERQGLAVSRAVRSVELTAEPHPGYRSRRVFPEGTLLVRGDRAGWRLARTLLRPDVPWDTTSQAFSYDLTAWSLTYAFGLEAHTAATVPDAAFEPRRAGGGSPGTTDAGASASAVPADAYGYLVPPSFEAAGPIARYLAAGGRVRAVFEPFRVGARRWPPGTYFLPGGDSAAAWLERAGLSGLAAPVSSGRTLEGADLGTGRALTLESWKIGVLAGDGVSAAGFGEVWYVLEQLAGIRFDALPARELRAPELTPYDVLVAPSGGTPPEGDREVLHAWLRAGGTLVAMGSSARWAGRELGDVEVRNAESEPGSEDEERQQALRTREERRLDRWERGVHGVVLPTVADPGHPLAWGLGLSNDDERFFALHRNDLSFEPDESFETVVHFPRDPEALSGVVSEAKLRELGASSWLVSKAVGRGRLILFADEPLFRAFWRSAFVLFTNALLLGPAT